MSIISNHVSEGFFFFCSMRRITGIKHQKSVWNITISTLKYGSIHDYDLNSSPHPSSSKIVKASPRFQIGQHQSKDRSKKFSNPLRTSYDILLRLESVPLGSFVPLSSGIGPASATRTVPESKSSSTVCCRSNERTLPSGKEWETNEVQNGFRHRTRSERWAFVWLRRLSSAPLSL